MNKKIAVFVEGLTEQEFTIKLISELAGKKGVEFEIYHQHGGVLNFVEIRPTSAPHVHVLVANCCSDAQVKSQINDQYQSLVSANYTMIVGLRDVYPLQVQDIPKLEKSLQIGLVNGSIPIKLHLAIMEIEAWFLEECTHYARIDPDLNEASKIAHGYDCRNVMAESLPNPAQTLDNIYRSVGKRYSKNRARIQRTVDALSYDEIYVNTSQNSSSLKSYIETLEGAIF